MGVTGDIGHGCKVVLNTSVFESAMVFCRLSGQTLYPIATLGNSLELPLKIHAFWDLLTAHKLNHKYFCWNNCLMGQES